MSVHPRRATTGGATVVVVALTLLIAGCVGPPEVLSTSTPTIAPPLFASDEEALAAAEQAYADYRSTTDTIAQDGGFEPERIESLVTRSQLVLELAAFEKIRESGYRQVGIVVIEEFTVQLTEVSADYRLTAYACLNYADAKFLGADDVEVRSGRTHPRLIVSVVLVASHGEPFKIAGNEPWREVEHC